MGELKKQKHSFGDKILFYDTGDRGDSQGEGTTGSTTGCNVDLLFGVAALALQVHSSGGHTALLTLGNTWRRWEKHFKGE